MLGNGDYLESEIDVSKFLLRVRNILSNGDEDNFLLKIDRLSDNPNDNNTTRATIISLQYSENDIINEINSLTTKEYLKSAIDTIKTNEEPYRIFIKIIDGKQIYIKFKIKRNKIVFCMSFHFAKQVELNLPYKI